MKKIVIVSTVCSLFVLLLCAYTFASGSGHHSHGHDDVKVTPNEDVIIYKDTKDGVDAYLEFSDIKKITASSSGGFLMKCQLKAFLKDSKSGDNLTPSRLVLRATIGHDQFGEALVFAPDVDNRMQTELFVKNKGEQHYLLIAEIEEVGVKEFHFHHTF